MEYTELLDFTAYLDVSRIHSPKKSNSEIIRDYIKKSNDSERSDEARTLELNEPKKKYCGFCGEPLSRRHKAWCHDYQNKNT